MADRGGERRWWRSLAVGCAMLAAPALAHEFKAGDLEIEHPWARPTVSVQKNGVAYLVVRNLGETPDRLLGARSAEAERVELHESTVTADGVARMREQDGAAVPARGEAKLAPGGLHLMLVNLHGRLFEGTTIPMTLVFERAGEVAIELMVESNSSAAAEGDEAAHGKH